MGTSNRQRRRAKKHKRQRAESARAAVRPQPARATHDRGYTDDELLRAAVLDAAEAFASRPEAVYRSQLDRLSALEARAGHGRIEAGVAWWVERGLDRAWATGWQPADVVRAVRRALGPVHADLASPAVARSGARRSEATTDDRWAGQVAALGGESRSRDRQGRWPALRFAIETVSVLLKLPPLPRLASGPRPEGRTGAAGSGAMLDRVRALLAKAESTTFAEEAEALTAKAQELMARHAIDQAMLEAGPHGGPAPIAGWRIGVDDPYAAPKSLLLHHIAAANRCRSVFSKELGFSTVFGAPSDLQIVELLFTSLLVQAAEAMLGAGRSVDLYGRSRTRSFRQSFLVAYAGRIGERLAATSAEVVAEAKERHGEALLPVLAGRAEAVGDAVRATFPHMVERGMRISNYSGWAAGRTAADLASLGVGDELPGG